MNRALLSLNGGSLEIALIVSLNNISDLFGSHCYRDTIINKLINFISFQNYKREYLIHS